MAETVTPARPCGPSVVTTLTVAAVWLMPSRNCCRSRGSGVSVDGLSSIPLLPLAKKECPITSNLEKYFLLSDLE